MASRIENLPLRTFLTNPTKISNALRQMRAPLRTDAVTCYYDSFLEAEALGATIDWSAETNPQLLWPHESQPGRLSDGLASPQEALQRGRVPIVLEVIRRMKTLLPAEILRTAVISGPLTLAAHLAQISELPAVTPGDLPDSARDLATSTLTEIAKAFAEAGANLIFLREDCTPAPDAPTIENWLSTLAPVCNIIRFYEATPVLQIAGGNAADLAILPLAESFVGAWPDCIVSFPLATLQNLPTDVRSRIPSERLGINLPLEHCQTGAANTASSDQALGEMIREFRPAIVTTAADLPIATDPKRVAALSDIVRHAS
jgi:Uroporphyrinogen decarboxylase (URO-D)